MSSNIYLDVFKNKYTLDVLCCDRLPLIFPPKIPGILLIFLLKRDKRVPELFVAQETTCKLCLYEYTRESFIISSTQVLFTEKCTGMNMGALMGKKKSLRASCCSWKKPANCSILNVQYLFGTSLSFF